MITSEERSCILDAVFDKKGLHNARRNGKGPPQSSKTFTADELKEMMNHISELRGKYAVTLYTESSIAIELVKIIDEYNTQIAAEYEFQLDQTDTA